MDKNEYLDRVNPFVEYLKDKIETENSFEHAYSISDGGNRNNNWIEYNNGRIWNSNSLHDAFKKYYWADRNYYDNKKKLSSFKKDLDFLMSEYENNLSSKSKGELQIKFMKCCRDILVWGGVLKSNTEWMVNKICDDNLIESFISAKSLLDDENPSIVNNEWQDNLSLYRMNAGYTKIFSLLCDNFIIYDSRVAAALGLLIQDFFKVSDKEVIDAIEKKDFRIRYMDAQGNQNRNPSGPYIKFDLMRNNAQHARWNIKINWLLSASIQECDFNWMYEKDGEPCPLYDQEKMRALESALFMIGYDIPQNNAHHY